MYLIYCDYNILFLVLMVSIGFFLRGVGDDLVIKILLMYILCDLFFVYLGETKF